MSCRSHRRAARLHDTNSAAYVGPGICDAALASGRHRGPYGDAGPTGNRSSGLSSSVGTIHNRLNGKVLACASLEATYHGKAAHASSRPYDGINALDGLILAYQAIAALRQHIKPTERIHGIITDGGAAANIAPERAAGRFFVRPRRRRI